MRTRAEPWGDPERVRALARRIHHLAAQLARPVTFMEVCGTHTQAIARAGLRRLLPANVRLVSGPGCPVCVTPVDYLDRALALARLPDVILATFGDLVRVPASRRRTLEQAKAAGADVRVVYAPRDALAIARDNPGRRVVFLGVGFETTVPTVASALEEAEGAGLANFLVLSGAKVIEPPLRALLAATGVRVDGFLLPGHVSVILGSDAYRFLVDEFATPGVVVGFGPVDIQLGLAELLGMVRAGRPEVRNVYRRVVTPQGNRAAQDLIRRWFVPADTRWRGLGEIPASGLALRPEHAARDAWRIAVDAGESREPRSCRCGEVLTGAIAPPECPLFAKGCTPEAPVGACMVSSEGTCAAWYRFERVAGGVGA